jgi:hypothetical protein
VLSGQRGYAHITAIRNDMLLPQWLGMEKLRSEDSVRRAFEKQDEAALTLWMDQQMSATYDALLDTVWVLDVDATVKTLYGKQEEAKVGYNPFKPGRPSHVYHAMVLTKAQLVLNVDVHAGNQTASAYAQPGILGSLDSRRPERIQRRGDADGPRGARPTLFVQAAADQTRGATDLAFGQGEGQGAAGARPGKDGRR